MALDRRTAWFVAIAAMLTMAVCHVDRNTLAVLAPAVTEALGISEVEYGWLAAAFALAYLLATPISGWLIDRVGARRGLLWAVVAWSTVAALHALAPGFGVLFALRILLGVTEGPAFPGSAQTVQRVLPPDDRARGFGFLFSGSSIGAMLVPPLASALYGWHGWRVAFLGTALVGLAWVPLWLLVTRRPAVVAQMDAAIDVAAPSTGRRPSFFEVARHPVVIRGFLAIFAVAPVLAFMVSWGAKYLSRKHGIEQVDIGFYLWLPPLMLDAGAILFGDRASRQRRAAGVLAGPAPAPRALFALAMLLATSLVLLPLATTPWESMLIIGLAVAGNGAIYTLATADLLSRLPPNCVSLAGGILACAASTAVVIVNPLIGQSVTYFGDYTVAAIGTGLWVVPGGLAWLMWRPRRVEF